MLKHVLVTLLFVASAWPQARPKNAALEGLDPVLLTEGQEAPGKETLIVQHGRFLYRFASEETRNRFTKDPAAYAIQLDGACARMGAPVGGSPDSYYVHDHRIYIFGSNDCYGKFSAEPAKYLTDVQANPVWNPSPEARAQGGALLKKAIEAMGGAARWKAIHSYVETHHISRPNGDSTTTNAARMPDAFRAESTFGKNSFGNLITPAGQFSLFRDEGAPLPKSFSQAITENWRHDLLPILLSRDDKGFDVFLAGANRLAVNNHGSISTLLLDPATGRITGIEWRGRSPEGFSDFHIAYSDYRKTDGVQLPFQVEGANQSWTVDSYQLNPPDIDARLRPPARIAEL